MYTNTTDPETKLHRIISSVLEKVEIDTCTYKNSIYYVYMVVESAVVFCHVVAAMLPPLMHMLLGAAAI